MKHTIAKYTQKSTLLEIKDFVGYTLPALTYNLTETSEGYLLTLANRGREAWLQLDTESNKLKASYTDKVRALSDGYLLDVEDDILQLLRDGYVDDDIHHNYRKAFVAGGAREANVVKYV